PATELENAIEVANTIRVSISDYRTCINEQNIIVTASFGISAVSNAFLNQEEAMKQAIRNADQALYTAKHMGRNNVQSYKEELLIC
ncbi:MAG TPA: diguanylate cyclase, partial [Ureibacillus sp.]|nr:diguanylate cyclase [Ureibacillus sp.]